MFNINYNNHIKRTHQIISSKNLSKFFSIKVCKSLITWLDSHQKLFHIPRGDFACRYLIADFYDASNRWRDQGRTCDHHYARSSHRLPAQFADDVRDVVALASRRPRPISIAIIGRLHTITRTVLGYNNIICIRPVCGTRRYPRGLYLKTY